MTVPMLCDCSHACWYGCSRVHFTLFLHILFTFCSMTYGLLLLGCYLKSYTYIHPLHTVSYLHSSLFWTLGFNCLSSVKSLCLSLHFSVGDTIVLPWFSSSSTSSPCTPHFFPTLTIHAAICLLTNSLHRMSHYPYHHYCLVLVTSQGHQMIPFTHRISRICHRWFNIRNRTFH